MPSRPKPPCRLLKRSARRKPCAWEPRRRCSIPLAQCFVPVLGRQRRTRNARGLPSFSACVSSRVRELLYRPPSSAHRTRTAVPSASYALSRRTSSGCAPSCTFVRRRGATRGTAQVPQNRQHHLAHRAPRLQAAQRVRHQLLATTALAAQAQTRVPTTTGGTELIPAMPCRAGRTAKVGGACIQTIKTSSADQPRQRRALCP